jgi:hypothetical protein
MTAVLGSQGIQENIWQGIEETLIVLEYEGVQENDPPDPVGELFRCLLNERSPKTMTNQNDLLQSSLIYVSDH